MSTISPRQEVKNILMKRGLKSPAAELLLQEYSALLKEWSTAYQSTGSHLTPENFADNLLQANPVVLKGAQ